jgi:hypothetical protein
MTVTQSEMTPEEVNRWVYERYYYYSEYLMTVWKHNCNTRENDCWSICCPSTDPKLSFYKSFGFYFGVPKHTCQHKDEFCDYSCPASKWLWSFSVVINQLTKRFKNSKKY